MSNLKAALTQEQRWVGARRSRPYQLNNHPFVNQNFWADDPEMKRQAPPLVFIFHCCQAGRSQDWAVASRCMHTLRRVFSSRRPVLRAVRGWQSRSPEGGLIQLCVAVGPALTCIRPEFPLSSLCIGSIYNCEFPPCSQQKSSTSFS